MKMILLILLTVSSALAQNSPEIKKEITKNCETLVQEMVHTNKKFPKEEIKNIKGLLTWRASACEKPPKGEGLVTHICDGDLPSGEGIFFWQKKTKAGKLKNGFYICGSN